MEFRYTEGSRFKADVNRLGPELHQLAESNDGRLETEKVIEFAKNPDTEAHRCFTWDDEKAAHEFRKEEARTLVRSVVVVHQGRQEPLVVNVKIDRDGDKAQYYSTPKRIRSNVLEQIAARDAALSRLDGARRGVEELENLLGGGEGSKSANRGRRLLERARAHVEDVRPTA